MVGEYKLNNGKHTLFKDYGNNHTIEITFSPREGIISELKDGDLIELRLHRDIKNDATVLYSGIYEYNEDKVMVHSLRDKDRESLDGQATVVNWHGFDDSFLDSIIDAKPGEYFECRIHKLLDRNSKRDA